jgi:hypothetical protein
VRTETELMKRLKWLSYLSLSTERTCNQHRNKQQHVTEESVQVGKEERKSDVDVGDVRCEM